MDGKVFLGHYLICVIIVLGQLHGYKGCIEKERKALLDLKAYLASQGSQPGFSAYDYILITWTNDTTSDCCTWQDVKCNLTSGRINGLGITETMYLEDQETYLLNLSVLHPLEELRSLNLSGRYAEFGGLFDNVEGYKSLSKLRNLEILDFSSNAFNNSILPFLRAATSLTTLYLRKNKMNGPFPFKELKDLKNLELLDLSSNRFNGTIPVRELSALVNLKALDLSGNRFSGSVGLKGICELKNMQELDLSRNKLVGHFPLCLTSLSGLRVLDLSANNFTGRLPSSLGNLESLEYFSLSDNDFEGLFSFDLLANLSNLKVFKLYSKSNSIRVELASSWKPKFSIRVIVLRSCNLEEVPHFLLHQKDLRQVDLSDNNISGDFPSWLLVNNTKLDILLLQNNSFTSFGLPKAAHNLLFLDVSMNDFNHRFPDNIGLILPRLRYMNLAKNGFQGNLPSSLGNMQRIQFLDISQNNFHGKLPTSFLTGCYSIIILELSRNKLSGEIFQESANFTSIYVLTMDNNQFTGNIGQGLSPLRSLSMLDVSNNNLKGVIPSWIGELQSLTVLLLSNNSLEGKIPTSLFNISYLAILDLSANNLSGDIPPHVNSARPVVLLMQDNNLCGVIPDTLLENVTVLDLRNNNLFGNIPKFSNTQTITILLLRGNNLTGHIPNQLCGLTNIHLLDLSKNKLNGSIPSCLSNVSFGLGEADAFDSYDFSFAYGPIDVFTSFNRDQVFSTTRKIGIYLKSQLLLDPFIMDYLAGAQTKVEFATKHRYDAYMGGNLLNFSGLDLSENELSGEIPVELGGLLKLHVLNLSYNYLSGVIPGSLSDMKNVESLDLSFNRLQGKIPPQLTDLSGLSVFNVSYNNLSGVIPQGRQFNTFDMRSYLGNPLLCGEPTNISCIGSNFQEPDNNGVKADESTIDMVSLIFLLEFYCSLCHATCWNTRITLF